MFFRGFPGGSVVRNPPSAAGDARDMGSDPWVRKLPWRRKWEPTPVFLPGKSHGQRSLVSYSPQGCKSWTQLKNEHSTALSCQKCPINVFNCLILWFIFCCIYFEQVYFKTVTILFVNFYPCRGYCVYFLIQSHRYFGESNGTPLQYSCLENPMDRGAW